MRIPRGTRLPIAHPQEVEAVDEVPLDEAEPDVASALEPLRDLSALEPFFDDGVVQRSVMNRSEATDPSPAPASELEHAAAPELEQSRVGEPLAGAGEPSGGESPWSAARVTDEPSLLRLARGRHRLLAHWRNDPFVLQRLAGTAVVLALAAVCVVVALQVLR